MVYGEEEKAMTIQNVSRAITAALLTCGVFAMTPSAALAQERTGQTIVLPEKGGPITLYGCFQRLRVNESDDPGMKFVLTRPTSGPATSVPEGSCNFTNSEAMVELDDVHSNVHKHHLDQAKVGQWIEVTGRLEKKGSQALREVHVETYRIVPVVVPTAPAATPYTPSPAYVPPAPPAAPEPVAAEPVPQQLPHTASSLPLTGLIGILMLAGGLALFGYRRIVG
jgi:LPXTG-motif cell wall-anchored protein